ncbi:MAG: hypothetical protein KAH22_03805 [Thiotrichaceae bacterium]|nr:hypothetical protein [Thiotrichaceae bacterium]
MKTNKIIGLAIALSFALTGCSSLTDKVSTNDVSSTKKTAQTKQSIDKETIVSNSKLKGDWVHPGLNYKWNFNEKQEFYNAQGTKGQWSEKEGEVVAFATNQEGNPSTWRFKLDPSGKTMTGRWTDPAGNQGQLTLIKQSLFDFSDISVAKK